MPGRSPLRIVWYDIGRSICQLSIRTLYRAHLEGAELVPSFGPALIVSNHQSFLDPMLNGAVGADRQIVSIARESLFSFRPFGWLLRSYGTIPIKDESGDSGAIKAALAELALGHVVLIYPEGSRSDDGTVQEFKRGVALLIRRAKVPVVPMGIDGACDVWPPSSKLPALRGRLGVKVGEPIGYEELMAEGPDAALARLRREIERLRLAVRGEIRRSTNGHWPLPGPTDQAFWKRASPGS